MRDMFEKAYKQKRAQEQWYLLTATLLNYNCVLAQIRCSKPSPDGDFPISRELDGLTSLLRGTVREAEAHELFITKL